MSPSTPPRRQHANTLTERPTTAPQSSGRMLVSSPPHSPRHIQNHLYQMFLEGQTADVAVVVRGSWQALYNLHRVILIQSDYFRTLFTMGYRESVPKSRSAPGSTSVDVIELHFDDPNITRAAFEICIARLYGGGPDLFVDQALLPSTKNPFPITSPPALGSAPPGSHPATPRFLLSLLATSNYLNIPSVSNQALNLVLSTISPWTITRYFGFAIGHGIGLTEGNEPEAAVGLDAIGQPAPAVVAKPSPNEAAKIDEVSPQEEEEEEEDLVKVGSPGNSTPHLLKDRTISNTSRETCDTKSICTEYGEDEQTFFYGVVGDKVGEACACWLTRWGADILALEETVEARSHPPAGTPPKFATPFPKLASSRGSSHSANNTPVPATFSSFYANMYQTASSSSSSLSSPSRRPSTPQLHPFLMSPTSGRSRSRSSSANVPNVAPRVWSRDGLPARWARAVMCADNLFVRGEWERFVYMTRVVELRRRQLAREAEAAKQDTVALKKIERLQQSEEREWDEMFKTGVYYSHISLEESLRISQEASSNGRPFVELSALQSAHWRQSVLRSLITSRSIVSSSRSSSPTPERTPNGSSAEGELGGLVSTAEILASAPDDSKVYYPIPSDASIRIGHDRSSTNELDIDFDILSSPPPPKIRRPASESDLFGLRPSRRTAREIIQEGTSEAVKWSTNEPFRFSVEFWGLDTLKEKNRLHSQTVWYAGSLYNVYVQVIKKKGMQLGVYLHRQSAVDPIPPASAPPSFVLLNPPTPTGNDAVLVSPSPSSLPLRSSLWAGSTIVPVAAPPASTPRTGTTPPDRDAPVTSPPSAPSAPWRDPRRIIRSYFILSCPSLIGSSITRFQSGPDDFKISQSWGWKSSCLWSENDSDDSSAIEDDWNSLRATVTIGVV
ncbi:hypothetical protein RSOLAG22IIIB_02514 [Rhizoctonia solani]|uniref:BTB domain-containing protein n=1 Tax=Rhizoctonia solani TaxID=456999 RepID=A0A0K6GGL9_9AGAM|nr:hypothetical protein RSOLAG22IIIB_02514 [Rhizoctonia solani]